MSSKTFCCSFVAGLFTLVLGLAVVCTAQTAKPAASYPTHLPYSFGNFVWWSNDELRLLLKARIPGLGDQIAPSIADEDRVRDALKALLKEKGITAEIQSQEPSSFSLSAERAPGFPEPAIVFTVASPQILVGKVVISGLTEGLSAALSENLRRMEGKEYNIGPAWIARKAAEVLEPKGYLESKVIVSHDVPQHVGEHYVVDLVVSVDPGPQYHISSITADGGPLLQGRDLSQHFTQKVGDVAGYGPFGQLAGELRSFYGHYGYADVETHGPPVLDHDHALASYHLSVIPGPIYHLRSLAIHNLDSAQEAKVRELLGMKPGDIFDETAISALYHKLPAEPLLAPLGFTFGPARDKTAAAVDLSLDFYKAGDKSSVTFK
jgi:outer membrane protein insertion porin family